jgi:hypothetical protein
MRPICILIGTEETANGHLRNVEKATPLVRAAAY